MNAPITVAILAAGESSRFGGCKQLALLDGVPLLQRMINTCRKVPGASVRVILGAHQPAILGALDFTGVDVLDNIHWREGIASSIRLAVESVKPNCNNILFVAADQAHITTDNLYELVNSWQQQPQCIVAAAYSGQVGIPALFPRSRFHQLLQLKGDAGARKLLLAHSSKLLPVDMPAAAIDIDTADDLSRQNLNPL